MELVDKNYDPRKVEARWNSRWEEGRYFHAALPSSRPTFSIVIPPPNITGSLHMGHALNVTLQDILLRWRRMRGETVLWLPGTDHAGIATQNVVERQLAAEGLTRQALGRQAFVERVWQWKETSGGMILNQLKRLGASCDWARLRFTLDEGLSRAVREVFVRLYEDGLIYRGERMINWCPRCRTALSDLEVEHHEVAGKLYTIHYPLADGKQGITVATTRPETMLGDTAVAVHPEDARYAGMAGKRLRLPIAARLIPVIADAAVDREFGTGAVKVTPAHDPHDFEIAQRHALPRVQVIGEDGRMTAAAGSHADKERHVCRHDVVKELEAQGFLVSVQDHRHAVGHCYRCKTIVEPLVSLQWFVRIAPLADPAIRAVQEGRITIIPKSWEATYFDWMYNIRDWCISRQLWWGHRIPAWHCRACGKMTVAMKDPASCAHCGGGIEQDPDVLDTWFSSALWPFSTLGWPDETPELKAFYPTTVLVTGFDILFFWVARMIMMGLRFMDKVPFKTVYIHALVRDAEGQKMSKSKGNVIDPVEIMDQYGTDALRFTLAAMASPGRDIKLSMERIEGYRNFCNKIWNAARFVLMNLPENFRPAPLPDPAEFLISSKWILSRLHECAEFIQRDLDEYRFDQAAHRLYGFTWHEFCDWYVEMAKNDLAAEPRREETLSVLMTTFETLLRLLHPFMPFITEEIWQQLPREGETLLLAGYPTVPLKWGKKDQTAEWVIGKMIEIFTNSRNLRSELRLPPSVELDAVIAAGPMTAGTSKHWLKYAKKLARLNILEINEDADKPRGSATLILSDNDKVYIPLAGLIDVHSETQRIAKLLEKVERNLKPLEAKLSSADFQSKAPPDVVAKTRQQLEDLRSKHLQCRKELEWMNEITSTNLPEGTSA
ncbi:MAG: valine--tRNA ligase [Nitrospirae bacterium]|nr:valine--tRNA ligase [Nitrospirota bacterium]